MCLSSLSSLLSLLLTLFPLAKSASSRVFGNLSTRRFISTDISTGITDASATFGTVYLKRCTRRKTGSHKDFLRRVKTIRRGVFLSWRFEIFHILQHYLLFYILGNATVLTVALAHP